MSQRRGDSVITCSFCGRSAHEVSSMVAGPDVYICDRCINDAAGIVRSDLSSYHPEPPHQPARRSAPLHVQCTPLEIKSALDE